MNDRRAPPILGITDGGKKLAAVFFKLNGARLALPRSSGLQR